MLIYFISKTYRNKQLIHFKKSHLYSLVLTFLYQDINQLILILAHKLDDIIVVAL